MAIDKLTKGIIIMLYFDESGYTGPDLTNTRQPFFTLASIRLSDDESAKIQEDIEYDKWGREFHFSSMYSNFQGREYLDRVFNHPLMDSGHVLLSFALKRYCVYAQIVNTLIETLYYHQGINLNENAMNLVMANGLYYCAIIHPNKELIAEFESTFIKMVRNPSVDTITSFYRTTDKLRYDANTEEVFYEALSEIPPTIVYIKEALSIQKFYVDLTIPLFSSSIQEWYKRTGIKDNVLFDSSEPFYANKDFLESLRDMDVPETEVGYGKRTHVYPFPVGNMEIAKSHKVFGIQLADIYASALNFVLTPRDDKYQVYKKDLVELPIFQSIPINVTPSTNEIIRERMNESAENDPLEFLCKHENYPK